ncbi:MAG: hypothetical protein ACK52T_09760 [Pseudanabaena sp.]
MLRGTNITLTPSPSPIKGEGLGVRVLETSTKHQLSIYTQCLIEMLPSLPRHNCSSPLARTSENVTIKQIQVCPVT